MESELDTLQNLINTGIAFGVAYGFQILGALIILVLGAYVARVLSRVVLRLAEKRGLDITLARFFSSTVRIMVLMFVVIIALGKFGITIAPFIAALGAIAFGGSLALQGPLSNYGAGLSIILSRPFVVGNTLTVRGVSGIVEEVRMAATILRTEDGEEITIPNKKLVGEILLNSFDNRIIETTIGISYADDPGAAIQVMRDTLAKIDDVTKEPAPQIGIDDFGDSSIDIGLRYWVPTERYFQVKYRANQAIYAALEKASITIPFPKREVHILNQETAET